MSVKPKQAHSGDRLAKRCNISQSKVSRIENARAHPSLIDLEQILRALDASPEVVAEVSALARVANTEWRNLRDLRRKGLGTRQAELKALEASSAHVRYFLLSMVTGLLATPEYIRASLAHSSADTSRAISGKLDRQAILYDASKKFTFLLTEQAARWPVVAPLALAEQLDRLTSLTYLPNIRLGVIPIGTPTPTTPLNTFTIYDTALATVETSAGSLVLRDSRDVSNYLREFSGYEKHASFGPQAREYLRAWADLCRGDL
ncbi:Scr1 family TA system antitoxin-like transcriptional regulator [Streptomyces olivoreticuli]|uniref:Scr1 family TA system antitoxin-like transcriptional regulator n=1 Tax=Streptomyces olivoreticuli TaxID=68246 RepID=UPI00265B2114|nr:Scr1 family TA system antitoxin-like transcriptional regulator [Streptomyces olivoreticuli]WKK21442.1 Scr1 family TA system antitoxin-like transcriptional regulator [Streptomyces olivoreticuli]